MALCSAFASSVTDIYSFLFLSNFPHLFIPFTQMHCLCVFFNYFSCAFFSQSPSTSLPPPFCSAQSPLSTRQRNGLRARDGSAPHSEACQLLPLLLALSLAFSFPSIPFPSLLYTSSPPLPPSTPPPSPFLLPFPSLVISPKAGDE